MNKGSCLCGAVHFTVEGALGDSDACHCVQCRKWSGHFLAGVETPRSALSIEGKDNITWYQFSKKVRRGFCYIPKIIEDAGFRVQAGCQSKAQLETNGYSLSESCNAALASCLNSHRARR